MASTTRGESRITLMLEPSDTFPVNFSVVEQGSDQEVKGFSTYIINSWTEKMQDGWRTDEYPNGKEVMLPAGKYFFHDSLGPLEYAGIKEQIFMVDGEGKVFVGETFEGPWTEKPDKLIRLEAVKGQIVTIHTSTVVTEDDSFTISCHLPDIVFSLTGDNGVCQSFTSGSNAMPVAVTPDVLYEITVHYNPWLMSEPDKTVFKVDRSGQLFLADEDGQLYEVPGSDIIIEFTPIGSIEASFAS